MLGLKLSSFYGWLFFFLSLLVFMFMGFSWSLNYFVYIFSLKFMFKNLFDCFSLMMYLDMYSLLFLLVLFLIVSSVKFFSYKYMVGEVYMDRFLQIVNLFVGSMVILILFPGLFSFLLGWDGLGLSSFMLVAWFSCSSSSSASLKTFLMKRLGDGFFVVSIVYFLGVGSYLMIIDLDLRLIVGGLLVFFLILACFTKSAQYPFSSWLPVAMAAPTPVSSLVHSSTLVTAGLYMLYRMKFMFSYNKMVLFCIIGLFTLFVASFSAVFEKDVKKMVAFSTLSQLGFLLFMFGLGLNSYFFIYMLVHALFKALMFMSVGLYLIVGFHNQDGRSLIKMWFTSPVFFFSFFFSVVCLCGFPMMSSFVMKDGLLNTISNIFSVNLFLSWLFFYSMVLTVIYSFRLFFVSSMVEVKFLKLKYSEFGVVYLFILMMTSLFFSGWFVETFFPFYMKVDFSKFFYMIMILMIGIYMSLMLKKNKFVFFFNELKIVLKYLKEIFFLVFLKSSMNSFLVRGSKFVSKMDSGFVLFRFSMFNKIYFYFMNNLTYFFSWMVVFFFSLIFVFFVYLL